MMLSYKNNEATQPILERRQFTRRSSVGCCQTHSKIERTHSDNCDYIEANRLSEARRCITKQLNSFRYFKKRPDDVMLGDEQRHDPATQHSETC